jgi:hypothetical protein
MDPSQTGQGIQALLISIDAQGNFALQLQTSSDAEQGQYTIQIAETGSGNTIQQSYLLSETSPVRPAEDLGESAPAPVQVPIPSTLPAQPFPIYIPIVRN